MCNCIKAATRSVMIPPSVPHPHPTWFLAASLSVASIAILNGSPVLGITGRRYRPLSRDMICPLLPPFPDRCLPPNYHGKGTIHPYVEVSKSNVSTTYWLSVANETRTVTAAVLTPGSAIKPLIYSSYAYFKYTIVTLVIHGLVKCSGDLT